MVSYLGGSAPLAETSGVYMDKSRMVALANRSPEMVARNDREGWLALFSSNGVVDDPVGAGPNRKGRDMRHGRDGLGRFYDIFIGPNRIEFDVHRDVAAGDEMVRDVDIKTTFRNGAVIVVHCYVLFRFVEENGRLCIESLRAHWDFVRSCLDVVKGNGFKGLTGSMVQFGNMIRVQGPARVNEYFGVAYRGIGKEGIRKAQDLAVALRPRDGAGRRTGTSQSDAGPSTQSEATLSLLAEPGATVDFPAGGTPLPWADFIAGPAGGIALDLSGLRSGGWFTSGRFHLAGSGPDRDGVVFFEFSPRTRRIVRARFFWE